MNATLIITLYLIWFGFWGLYNFFLINRQLTTEETPQILVPIYAILALLTHTITFGFSITVGIVLITIVFLGILIRTSVIGRLANSIFQIIWLSCLGSLLNPSILLVAINFLVGHLPIIFIQHIKLSGKLLILLFSFFGGCVLAIELLYIRYPYGLTAMILTHYITYVLIRPYDAKYKWGIIN